MTIIVPVWEVVLLYQKGKAINSRILTIVKQVWRKYKRKIDGC